MERDAETFGQWLHSRRKELKISPREIIKKLGYRSLSIVYDMEYGYRALPLDKWPLMAEVLQMPFEEFLKVMKRCDPYQARRFQTRMVSFGQLLASYLKASSTNGDRENKRMGERRESDRRLKEFLKIIGVLDA